MNEIEWKEYGKVYKLGFKNLNYLNSLHLSVTLIATVHQLPPSGREQNTC